MQERKRIAVSTFYDFPFQANNFVLRSLPFCSINGRECLFVAQ